MTTTSLRSYAVTATAALMLVSAFFEAATAQDLGSLAQQNIAFDNGFYGQLNSMRAQNQIAQQRLMQGYVSQFGPKIHADYQQFVQSTGMHIPFEQFAYQHLITRGGTEFATARQLQNDQFNAAAQANRTVQEGYASYNQGYWNNQQRTDAAATRYSNEAIRGNGYDRDPSTGETTQLPYAPEPGSYASNNGSLTADSQGQWSKVDSLGYIQELEPASSDDWED